MKTRSGRKAAAGGSGPPDLLARALSPRKRVAAAASKELFREVVEPLSDSFSARQRSRYERLFLQLIGLAREVPEAQKLDRELRRYGIQDAGDQKEWIAVLIRIQRHDYLSLNARSKNK